MPGVLPFFIEGRVSEILSGHAYIKVDNGNVYTVNPQTPGINFKELKLRQVVELEVTDRLTRVFSARIMDA